MRRVQKSLLIISAALMALTFTASGAFAEEGVKKEITPVGTWKTIDDNTGKPKSLVVITERKGKLYAKITKLLNQKPGEPADPVCDKCEGKRKDKKIIGMTIMWNMARDDDEWEGGKILDPENGEIYRCKIWLDGNAKLKVRGYWGPFHRTQDWHRVK